MPVAAAPPTRFDMYPQTQRMGTGTMMAGPTSQIPPVEEYDYAGRDYDYAGRGAGGGGAAGALPRPIMQGRVPARTLPVNAALACDLHLLLLRCAKIP